MRCILVLTETQTLTNKTLIAPNITGTCNISSISGFGSLEVGGAPGGFIDLKTPFSDDYDLRIIQGTGNSNIISKTSLILQSNDTTALTIDTSQNSTFVGGIVVGTDCNIGSGNTYKINGVDLSGANLNDSRGVTINTEIYNKQDTLTFGKIIQML